MKKHILKLSVLVTMSVVVVPQALASIVYYDTGLSYTIGAVAGSDNYLGSTVNDSVYLDYLRPAVPAHLGTHTLTSMRAGRLSVLLPANALPRSPFAETILSARVWFAHQYRQEWIVSQFVMVVEIFVAQCQSENPLGDQLHNRMLDQLRVAVIRKAAGKSCDD